MGSTLVVHGHFYQPPRENPWTEEIAREPSAAPAHDWNERVAAEAYRPNAVARIVDDTGRIVDIVDNYALLSYDVGPTLLAWLERHDPETHARIQAADRAGGGAMAQAYGHTILPLATERDARTQVRWGLADFAHRFGRPAEGMWLPEAAVDERVLAVLVEEGVGFTVLAPHQAARTRPLDGRGEAWKAVDGGIDTSRPWRWLHPDGSGRGLDIVFYDGPLSHAVAFEMATLSSGGLIDRVQGREGLVTLAADGETFGHHHRWGERLVAHALAVEAPRRGVAVTNLARHLAATDPAGQVQVRPSSWSCVHGVGRWSKDCGCSTGGQPGWNQRWRAPLRRALDRLQDRVDEVFEARGPAVLADPWAARDAYVQVVLGAESREAWAARHVIGDRVEAFTLLEAQRAAMAMFTSCGWFFHDLAGLETVQVLRYAARAMDLVAELGEDPGEDKILALLAKAESNQPDEGTGRDVWRRHVLPAKVDDGRTAAHIALVGLVQQRPPAARVGAYRVEVLDHDRADRGGLALCTGKVALTHVRTGRPSEHVYAAVHLGGLDVAGATRPADPDREVDRAAFSVLRGAFAGGARVTTLLRYVSDGFGPRELDLSSALPDGAEAIVEGTAKALADRFANAFELLFTDHRETLEALAAAGYPLPAELRVPAELALGRRLEAALEAGDHRAAQAVAAQAKAGGFVTDTPRLQAVSGRLLSTAVTLAVQERAEGAAAAAVALLRLAAELGLHLPVDQAQEAVHQVRRAGDRPDLDALAHALYLA